MSPLFMIKKITRHHVLLPLLCATALTIMAPHAFAKKDLFSSEPSSSQPAPAQEMRAAPAEKQRPAKPTISAPDAAARAQKHANGKVMNVRQYQDDDKTLYGIKVLKKNGRMKTINVDADNGAIVE